jgi:hypothetical protein
MKAPGRNWHEVYLLVLTVAFAAMAWATGSQEQTIAGTFPAWSQQLWYGGLVVGAVVGLLGIALHTLTGMLIERAALLGLSGLCAAYGAAFLAHASRADLFHAVFVVVFVAAYAVVNLARACQVRREINQVRAQLQWIAAVRSAAPESE